MKFPDSADKGLQYEQCAYILADTVGHLGYTLTPKTRAAWGSMMYKLAEADEVSEVHPEAFTSGEALVAALEIEPNDMAVGAAAALLDASQKSIHSNSIREHLDNRRDEAVESVTLLRSQTPEFIGIDSLWEEVDTMTIAGIYLDSLVDAKEDAGERAGFSASQLALHSAFRFTATVRSIRAETKLAIIRSCTRYGLAGHILRSTPRKLFAQ